MLISEKTQARIVELMEKGAKLVYNYYHHEEFGNSLVSVVLQYHDQKLTLSHVEKRLEWRPTWESSPCETVCPAADEIVERDDIQDEYPGYISDYGHDWREVYGHKCIPVPRWITEQWASPVSRYDDGLY